MLQFVVEVDEEGLRSDRFLRRRHPAVDRKKALKILKQGRIMVGEETARLTTVLNAGDVVQIVISPGEAGPAATETPLIFSAPGVVVVDKPAGIAMHTGTGVEADEETLRGKLAADYNVEEGFSGPSFLGRLDRQTSGLVIAALSKPGLRQALEQWERGEVEKSYLVVVHGHPAEKGCIDFPLASKRPRHQGKGRVQEAQTRFVTLAQGENIALLLAFLDTGRTHQIRRHFKGIGHPVVGDRRYGDRRRDRARGAEEMMLHAWRYRFSAPGLLPKELVTPLPKRLVDFCAERGIDVAQRTRQSELR